MEDGENLFIEVYPTEPIHRSLPFEVYSMNSITNSIKTSITLTRADLKMT